ncbi:MAG: hypothetical protein EXQ74_01335 [Thermoleophilia bacterium]|nr:hypothetical protein [Thermoleophilia bacterium]
MADADPDEITEEDVRAVYDVQARLTRTVGRDMLVFAVVWFPALLIVPAVFHAGALWSLLVATSAAVAVTVVLERFWLRPRATARADRGHIPPPPIDALSGVRRVWRRITDLIPR